MDAGALATALFAKIEVEGYQKMFYALTPDAIELGLNAAVPAEFVFTEREFGRGERSGADTSQLIVHIDAGERRPLPLVQSA